MKHLLFFCLLFNITLFIDKAVAEVVVPRIFILSPLDGDAVYDEEDKKPIFYNLDDETVTVFGSFFDVPDELIQRGDAIISVNGLLEPANFSFTDSRVVDGKTYRSGLFNQKVPLNTSNLWPMRKFYAEIVNIKTFEALARFQMSLYDLRNDANATPNESINTQINGMSSQLTDRGIGHRSTNDDEFNLEKILNSLLPSPNLNSFNDKLTSRARNIARYDNDSQILNKCVKYSKLKEKNFKDEATFKAYKKVFKKAKLQNKAYKAAKKGCENSATAAAACLVAVESTFCVKSKPKPKDFDLCVDQLEGDVQSLTISKFAQSGLNFEEDEVNNRGLISSNVTLKNLNGKINGYLRSLSVRWRNNVCILEPPRENVDDSYITKTKWLNKWATCKLMTVEDVTATTRNNRAGVYQIKSSQQNPEHPEVTLAQNGEFNFLEPISNSNKGTCKESFINTEATSMIEAFRNNFHEKLQNTWYSDSPNTMEAIELTKIMSPYRLGELDNKYYGMFSALDVFSSLPLSGLRTYWRNQLTSTDQDTLLKQKTQWFHSPVRGIVYSQDGRDSNGNLFDMSYTINTALLNKILNIRTATPQGLHQIYKPSWADLEEFGVRTPSGESPDDKATLDRSTLVKFDSAFLNIGNKKLQIEVKPIFDPIVYMTPDVTAETEIPNVGAKTIYGIEALEVSFKEKDRNVNGQIEEGQTWLRLRGGFFDQDFNFTISNRKEALYLLPNLITDIWGFNIIGAPKVLCNINFSGNVQQNFPCEERLERSVSRLMKKAFRDTFIELLSKVPAPQKFDALDTTKKVHRFAEKARRQENQNITFYGEFKE